MSIQKESLLGFVESDYFRLNLDHQAIIYDDGETTKLSFSYRTFSDISERLGTLLRSMEVKEQVITIAMHSSPFLVPPLMIGILKAGGIFSYLDLQLPKIRQNQLLASANTKFILTENSFQFDSSWKVVKTIELMGIQINIFKCTKMNDSPSFDENLAYIIHTSGSTGTPKVVKVPHSCILPNINDLRQQLAVTNEDIIFMASPFSFDPSIVDIFLALSTGASLLIVSSVLKCIPAHLARILNHHRVTLMQATPSLFLQFNPEISVEYLLSYDSSLRAVILGGEPFPSLEAIRIRQHPRNQTAFYNIYGITEVSSWATITRVNVSHHSPEKPKISLGKPMKSTRIAVLDDSGNEVNEGEGHLHIGERFCLVDSETVGSVPILRPSGDLVEVSDGNFYFKGRMDDTVKRMGKRITYHSVEHLATESGFICKACAVLDARQRLILAVSLLYSSDENRTKLELKEFISSRASEAEIPDEIVIFPDIPMTQNGKTDRRKVFEFVESQRKRQDPSEWERFLVSKWKESAHCMQDPTEESNFVFSGGNSMTALNLVGQMEDAFDCHFPQLLDNLLNSNWAEVRNCVHEALINPTATPIKENMVASLAYPTVKSKDEYEISLKWKFNLKKCIDATPFIMNGSVFIGSHSHLISGIDLKTGNHLWTTELPDRIESSATGHENRIFVGCYDGRLYCLDASNGVVVWSFQTGDHVKCSPVHQNERLYFGSHDQHVYCLDFEGRMLWKRQCSKGSVFSRPVCDRFLLAASLDGTCCALCPETGQVVWTFQCPKPVFGGLSVLEDKLLIPCVDGTLYTCSIQDGRPLWDCRCDNAIFSSPRVFGTQVIFGCHDNFVYCVNGQDGSILWRVDFSSAVYATPFVCDVNSRHLVIGCSTRGKMMILDLSDGRVLGEIELPGEIFSSPVMYGNRIVVGCRDDFVYCFQLAEMH